jgi:hypothetical protein
MFDRESVHENEIFRFQQCGLTVHDTANLCCVNVSQVQEWDKGKRIPPVCRRLMALYSGRDLEYPGWFGWSISSHRITMPSGDFVSPRQIEQWFTLYGDSYRRVMSPVRRRLTKQRFFR